MKRIVALIICFGALASPVSAQQVPTPYGPPIGLGQARQIVAGATRAAGQRGFSMAIAIVEPNGALVAFEKMDGTQYGSERVAQEKAQTAARFRRPTKAFSDSVAAGRTAVLSLPGVVAVEGGVPIIVNGRIVGAIGVSGGTSEEDGEIAAAALSAFRP